MICSERRMRLRERYSSAVAGRCARQRGTVTRAHRYAVDVRHRLVHFRAIERGAQSALDDVALPLRPPNSEPKC